MISVFTKEIFDRVLAEMQNFDEIGGVNDTAEYIEVMNMLEQEIITRRDNAMALLEEEQARGE